MKITVKVGEEKMYVIARKTAVMEEPDALVLAYSTTGEWTYRGLRMLTGTFPHITFEVE